ncbi:MULTISPECIES: hypothetical protein [Vallitalea]|uniref:Ubiquitin-like domain-containing protein n=2 Tax=Vallitalea TaxID=1348611 RepID=A0A8J8M9Y7_9FIRM|nr:hypothetical protein [Vallitalea guaymasensis]QUH29101.1 hypothetical protein HYG85_09265 [Vallitalea guaymasensis]GMQ63536.1 hypothetical protein AN2V17_27700 [Vallitalea sp. AN17-2]
MDKINVEVIVPAINKKYEFLLPIVMKVNVAKQLMTGIVCNLEGINFDNENLMLCYIDKGEEIGSNLSIEEAGIKDGSKLLMV